MIYYLLLDRKERYPSYEDEDLPPRNDVGQYNMAPWWNGMKNPLHDNFTFTNYMTLRSESEIC